MGTGVAIEVNHQAITTMKRRLRSASVALFLTGVTLAGQNSGSRQAIFQQSAAAANTTYTYPGDVPGANFTTAWPLFAFTRAKANAGLSMTPVVDVKGLATATSCTIFLLGDGTPNVDLTTSGAGGVGHQCAGGARTFCSRTNSSCTIINVYDATGGGQNCNVIQGTLILALDQPSAGLIAVDSGVEAGEKNWCLAANIFAPATGNASFSFFGERTSTEGYAVSIAEADGGNTIEMGGGPGQWRLDIGSGEGIPAKAADNSWHAANAIIDGTINGSIINIDGTETAGGPIVDYPYRTAKRPYGFTNNNSTLGGGSHTYGVFAGFSDNNLWSQPIRQQLCHSLWQIEGQVTPEAHC